MKQYTVWVGGIEVNDNYLTKKEAENLAFKYKDAGYDDAHNLHLYNNKL